MTVCGIVLGIMGHGLGFGDMLECACGLLVHDIRLSYHYQWLGLHMSSHEEFRSDCDTPNSGK